MWKPIKTVPKDVKVLVCDGQDYYAATFFKKQKYWAAYCGQPVVYNPEPTHWMPLL